VLAVVLTPLSWLWRAVTAWRNRRFDRSEPERVEGVRVVSVGNLAVGGTGKTPFASWAARTLAVSGFRRPTLVLSGYGADEVTLHRRWTPDFEVVADADRVAAARVAADAGADALVVDDGFQHRRLARDVDIVLLAVEDRFPGRILPCGPYREPPGALARADAVVLTRRSGTLDEARMLEGRLRAVSGVRRDLVTGCLRLAAGELLLFESYGAGVTDVPGPAPGPAAEVSGQPVRKRIGDALALTAIARPEAFLSDVESRATGSVELLAFPDHHDFSEADVREAREQAGARAIVVTEKDAVKLREHIAALGEAWVLRQRLVWDWGESDVRALLTGGPS
jgi:tetraacyldisaccharide 4'-kinase